MGQNLLLSLLLLLVPVLCSIIILFRGITIHSPAILGDHPGTRLVAAHCDLLPAAFCRQKTVLSIVIRDLSPEKTWPQHDKELFETNASIDGFVCSSCFRIRSAQSFLLPALFHTPPLWPPRDAVDLSLRLNGVSMLSWRRAHRVQRRQSWRDVEGEMLRGGKSICMLRKWWFHGHLWDDLGIWL